MAKLNAKFNRCLKMIKKYPEAFIVGKGSNEDEILATENRLQVTFPPMYKEFLKKFSYLATYNEEIWGISPFNEKLDIVSRLERYNEELSSTFQDEVPSHLLGIQMEDFNSSLTCLDLNSATYNNQDVNVCFYPIDDVSYYADSFTQVLFEVCDSAVSSYLDDTANVPSLTVEK